MSTKREEITKIINKFVVWGIDQKLPFFNQKEKVDKFRQDYTTDHIAGLVMKFLVPAYNEGIDTLRLYMKAELERLRIMYALSNADPVYAQFQLSDEQEEEIIHIIVKVITILQS